LPTPARRAPATVARLLAESFPHTRFLGDQAAAALLAELASAGIAGGAVYDALVGACASEHGVVLATRDRRALEVYRALDVRVELIAPSTA
jgi:predicted nucleic acid-binding protein